MKNLILLFALLITIQTNGQIKDDTTLYFGETLELKWDTPNYSIIQPMQLKFSEPYSDPIKDLIEYNQRQNITVIAVAFINLGAMILLKDKYSWAYNKQKIVTPLVLFSTIALTATLTFGYNKRKKNFYNKYLY